MLYIAQRITEGGRLDSIRAVDALSVGRLFTPSALVDALFLDRLDVSSLPPLSWTPYFWIVWTLFTPSLVMPYRSDVSSLPPLSWTHYFWIVWMLFTPSLVMPYRLDALRRSVVVMDIVFREEGKILCNFVNNNKP